MRRSLTPLCAICVCAGLAGCTVVSTSREGTSPLKVDHANGETFVPGMADRVVTLETDALDDTLAIGVKPLGAAAEMSGGRLPPYLGRRAANILVVGRPWRLDLRAIAGLDPDLILGSKHRQGSLYQRLTAIGSTVNVQATGVDWKLNLRLYGEALDRVDAAERLLTHYDGRIARLRRELGPARRTVVSLVRTTPQGVFAYGRGSFAGSVLGDLGLRRPESQDLLTAGSLLSADQIPSLDADLVLVSRAPGDGATYRRLTADPRWQALRAVRSRHVRFVPDDAWMVGQGILASRVVTADLRRLLGR